MSEIFREVDEALTYDRLRTLWRRHRVKIAAALLLALASLAAWQAWQYRERQKQLRSAETFYELARKQATAQDATQELSPQEQKNLRGGYRMLWLFARAKALAERQEWQKAQQALQEIHDDVSLPALYRDYAQILQASLDIEQGNLTDAEQRLAPWSETNSASPTPSPTSTSALRGLALYLQASLLAAQGNRERAREQLTRARAQDNLAPALRRQLQEAGRTLDSLP